MLRPTLSRPLLRLCTLLILALSISPSHAVDLGRWARHQRQHEDWTSLDFRDPASGLFVAARAGTEDPRTGTTLTLTMAPALSCRVETVFVKRTDSPVIKARDDTTLITFQLAGLEPQPLRARLVTQPGDGFIFVKLLDETPIAQFQQHKRLTVTLPDGDDATFSLAGFEKAWNVAQETCQAFLLP